MWSVGVAAEIQNAFMATAGLPLHHVTCMAYSCSGLNSMEHRVDVATGWLGSCDQIAHLPRAH